MTAIRYLSTADVGRLIEPAAVLAALTEGFKALSAGQVQAPPRPKVDVPHKGFALAMLAWMPGQQIALKTVNVFEGNHARHLPSHMGLISLFDRDTGAPLAVMDAALITGVRTAGAAMLSVTAMARTDALVERTAAYLDGAGRKDAKALTAAINVVYATESMRLTTRLLDLAAWLLMRRALRDGEITPEEAHVKRRRIRLGGVSRPAHVKNFDELPHRLRALIEESFALQDRIVRMDRAFEAPRTGGSSASINPVGNQLAAIEAAFGGMHRAH